MTGDKGCSTSKRLGNFDFHAQCIHLFSVYFEILFFLFVFTVDRPVRRISVVCFTEKMSSLLCNMLRIRHFCWYYFNFFLQFVICVSFELYYRRTSQLTLLQIDNPSKKNVTHLSVNQYNGKIKCWLSCSVSSLAPLHFNSYFFSIDGFYDNNMLGFLTIILKTRAFHRRHAYM